MSEMQQEGVASENTTTEPKKLYCCPPEVGYCCPGYKLFLTEETEWPQEPQCPPGVAPWEWTHSPEYKEYIKGYRHLQLNSPVHLRKLSLLQATATALTAPKGRFHP